MFFHKKITSIRPDDKVLEIGPGSSPHPRANAFLEYRFSDEFLAVRQRGDIEDAPNYQGRPVTHYSGDLFPFKDGEFDYVIASHVLEHVPNPDIFMSEIYRVGKGRGYLEFPLPPYDYLFDFDVHTQLVWFDEAAQVINYLRKSNTHLNKFESITSQLRKALEMGWDDLVASNLEYFFVGIEFEMPIPIVEQVDLSQYSRAWSHNGNSLPRKIGRKITRLLGGSD
jgi:SAM-dependent methyltransferase